MTTVLQGIAFADAWRVMAPEMVLTAAGFLLMLIDAALPPAAKRAGVSTGVALIALLVAGVLALRRFGQTAALGPGSYLLDDYALVFKLLFMGITLLILLLSLDDHGRAEGARGEYTYLLLFATVGAMVMASSADLVTLFVGLEILSVSSYVLVGLRRSSKSAEGAMKYLVIGAIASACVLFGMSYIYGVTGTTHLAEAGYTLFQAWDSYRGIVVLGLLLMLAGFSVKISVVPFHMWAPDAYEGAPTPITAFLAAASKAAGFAMLVRVFLYAFASHFPEWGGLWVGLAAVTMVAGNLLAIVQRNVKRMLAYSSIGQAGYLLVPFAVLTGAYHGGNLYQDMSALYFYLAAYALMTAGAFAVLTVVAKHARSEDVDAFTGLFRRSPLLAGAMAVFLVAMAGMPLTSGFAGKFFIALGAINTGYYWLAGLMFLTSVMAFAYYFGLVRRMYLQEPYGPAESWRTPAAAALVVVVALVGTIGLGVAPGVMMHSLPGLNWFGQ
ncbi:MAG: NADH-quinone oxidoreductase subunit N [Kyrpidia sp.]|nr:NADH-quinone oxidoreductase subunit N [Kyrpidia sp.]